MAKSLRVKQKTPNRVTKKYLHSYYNAGVSGGLVEVISTLIAFISLPGLASSGSLSLSKVERFSWMLLSLEELELISLDAATLVAIEERTTDGMLVMGAEGAAGGFGVPPTLAELFGVKLDPFDCTIS